MQGNEIWNCQFLSNIIQIKIMNLNYQLIKSFLSKFGPYYASGGGIPARTRARVKRPKRGPKWEWKGEKRPRKKESKRCQRKRIGRELVVVVLVLVPVNVVVVEDGFGGDDGEIVPDSAMKVILKCHCDVNLPIVKKSMGKTNK